MKLFHPPNRNNPCLFFRIGMGSGLFEPFLTGSQRSCLSGEDASGAF